MPDLPLPVEVLAAAALAGIAAALGARVRRLLRVPLQPGLRLAVDFVVGGWVLAAVLLLLGLLHAWRPWLVACVPLVLAVVAKWRGNGWRSAQLLGPLLGAAVALPLAVAPPFFYDALVYHLGLPWQALLEGGLHAHPEDLFSAFPPLAQLLAAMPLAVGLVRVPALVNWWSFVLAGAAVGALSRTLGAPRWAALLAAACVPLLPGDALVAGLPAAEGLALVGIVTAVTVALGRAPGVGAASLAGLLVGAATAARVQGVPWALIVIVLIVVRSRERWRAGLAAAGGWLAGSAPWWVKNLVLLGAPLAPIGWRGEGAGILWREGGVLMNLGLSPLEMVRQLTVAVVPHAAYLAPLALAAVLASLPPGGNRPRLAAVAALAALAAWGLTGIVPRFLAPALGVVLAVAGSAARRGRPGAWAAGLALAVTAAVGVTFGVTGLRRFGPAWLLNPTRSVSSGWLPNDPFPAFAAARGLPARARVLFVGEPRGFGFPRRFVAPSQFDVSPLRSVLETSADPGEACARLRRRGFTHILVNWGELDRLAVGYPVAPWRDVQGWRRWRAFVTRLGPPVVDVASVQVFALSPAGPPV
ncbi:MAG: hypothetical protein EPN53_00470 [Acidobacteria bacterium]|nr:MAG: hypothetical protein EPN53_00470 [Acidobacteriota bacterium]